jgi:TPR repeat protein
MTDFINSPSQEYMKYLELYENNKGKEALKFLEAAASINDPLALHTLGYMAETAQEPDIDRALKLYRKAAKLFYEPSMINLARIYEKRMNYRQYFYWIKKSMDFGSIDSQLELKNPFPYLLNTGNIFRKIGNFSEAKKIYKFCMRHGNTDAMINLANMIDLYDNKKNKKKSEYIYKLAVERGSGLAAHNLAVHYMEIGEKKEADKYFKISKRLGHLIAS